MIDTYEIIKQINEQKKDAHITPYSALFAEVMNEISQQVKNEINGLVGEGKLKFHRTINGVSFDVIDENNNFKQK